MICGEQLRELDVVTVYFSVRVQMPTRRLLLTQGVGKLMRQPPRLTSDDSRVPIRCN